jgi:hypothetical protein
MSVVALVAATLVACAQSDAPDGGPAIYQYVYPHNTSELIENHYIVLDSIDGTLRGWYYGTSDEFDSGREGYLPGFFVAEMEGLRVANGTISFALRPSTMFKSPVPLQNRTSADVRLEKWTGPQLQGVSRYSGSLTTDQIVINTNRGARTFTRSTGD